VSPRVAPFAFCAVLALALAPFAAGCKKPEPPAPAVPDALKAPAGEVVVVKALAKGAQVYECKDDKWVLSGPEAELTDESGAHIGRHSAGPTWELADGSKVVGELVQKADAPDAQAIPWLLLRAKSTEGKGTLTRVTSIQRVDTVGGKAPASCGGQPKLSVPYSATYYFYARST
jgi:hypothetical protein